MGPRSISYAFELILVSSEVLIGILQPLELDMLRSVCLGWIDARVIVISALVITRMCLIDSSMKDWFKAC